MEKDNVLYEKPSNVTLETAKPQDAEAICDIRDRAWLEAYPNVELGITTRDIEINAKGLNSEFVPRRIAYLEAKLTNPNRTDVVIYVAKLDNRTIGYIEPIIENNKKMISALYIDPAYQGGGVGSMLMVEALNWLGDEEDIYLEVVAYNQRAINFYKKFGFQQTDNVVDVEEGRPPYMTTLPQIEMVLPSTKNTTNP